MKVISWNVNGLRAVYKKGFLDWLEKENADIVCLQEIKTQRRKLPPKLINPPGYYSYLACAKRKGYAGVVVYSKRKPLLVEKKIGFEKFDRQGRFLKLTFAEFTLINIYIPHGGRQKENLAYKLKAYDYLFDYLRKLRNKKLILIGDFNIAHKEIDLTRPKQNKNNIMFTPEERQQIDRLIKLGFVDSFRKFNKKGGHYTWWPYAYKARERNLGWRIDYVFASKKLTSKIKNAFILSDVPGSDHCPIEIKI